MPRSTADTNVTSTTAVTTTGDTKIIVALIAWGVLFAIIGREIEQIQGTAPKVGSPQNASQAITSSGRIIVGGFAAAALLSLLAHAGGPGRTFAVGLAAVTAISSMLVYGQPVWTELAYLTRSSPGATPTTPTASTAPTVGATNTTVALAQAA
jgi:hypothetical protein